MSELDIHVVAELLREKHREIRLSDPKATDGEIISEWLQAKRIDGESLDKVIGDLVEAAFERVMGKLHTGTGNPAVIQKELQNVLGIGFELGYTTSELQLEKEFQGEIEDDTPDN